MPKARTPFADKSLVQQEISIANQCDSRLAKLPPESATRVIEMLQRCAADRLARGQTPKPVESTEQAFG